MKLVDGGAVRIPEETPTPYTILLFHRGHWCRHYLRQLAEFEGMQAELEAHGATIYGISADTFEQAQTTMSRGLTFPVAYGVTRDEADLIGAWWIEERGGFMLPAEFVIERHGVVLSSLYVGGGPGGISPEQTLWWIARHERGRRQP